MINDEMNNVFAKYERYISHRTNTEPAKTAALPSAAAVSAAKPAKNEHDAAPLIDFGGDAGSNQKNADLSAQLAGMSKKLIIFR